MDEIFQAGTRLNRKLFHEVSWQSTGKLQVPVYMQNSGCLHANTRYVEQDINALIPVHMVPLPSTQYPRVDSIAFVVFVLSSPATWGPPPLEQLFDI